KISASVGAVQLPCRLEELRHPEGMRRSKDDAVDVGAGLQGKAPQVILPVLRKPLPEGVHRGPVGLVVGFGSRVYQVFFHCGQGVKSLEPRRRNEPEKISRLAAHDVLEGGIKVLDPVLIDKDKIRRIWAVETVAQFAKTLSKG